MGWRLAPRAICPATVGIRLDPISLFMAKCGSQSGRNCDSTELDRSVRFGNGTKRKLEFSGANAEGVYT
ncbi:hypothetical protein TNCV_2670831 [Trichonephila clavipes]|nr:hypothetical protein TNCV_2670831 [Trichonephila clavipes]